MVQAKFNLIVCERLDRSKYLDENDLPTSHGSKSITNVLVHGLIGNIHQAHQRGQWNDAEHMRYIISELERGFVAITTVDAGTF